MNSISSQGYNSQMARQAFLALPETDQITLESIHRAEAEAINDAMNARALTALEDAGIKAPESATGVIDRGEYFEVDGWKVSKENLGAPTLPAGEIEINAKKASRTKPQAWSTEVDGQTLWFYNYEGALREIEHRGEYAPLRDELLQMLNSVPGNNQERAQALNIPFAGYRYAVGGEFDGEGAIAYLWSASPDGDVNAQCTYLHRDYDVANVNWYARGMGFPVRSFLDKKRA